MRKRKVSLFICIKLTVEYKWKPITVLESIVRLVNIWGVNNGLFLRDTNNPPLVLDYSIDAPADERLRSLSKELESIMLLEQRIEVEKILHRIRSAIFYYHVREEVCLRLKM
jgi:hypothetical protein